MAYPILIAYHFDMAPKYPLYVQAATRLKKRCNELNIPCDICSEDLWKYREDFKKRIPRIASDRRLLCRYIPIFIEKKLRQHKQPVLYVHVDSVIVRKPKEELFEPDMSIGYCTHPFRDCITQILNPTKMAIEAAPLFFRPDNISYTFLGHWNYMCQNFNTDESEHTFLGKTINNFSMYPEMKPFKRPISNQCKIDDPDILHGQALNRAGEVV